MEQPTPLAHGKTKVILPTDDPSICKVRSLDDMTAGDGAKHALIPGKGVLSTRTTSNIFAYLRKRGIPVAFISQSGDDAFLAEYCRMIPLEIIGRFRVDQKSSYLKRNPACDPDTLFGTPVTELFLKTTGRRWKGRELPCDDPYLEYGIDDCFHAFVPNRPVDPAKVLLKVTPEELGITTSQLSELLLLSDRLNAALKEAFDSVGADLADHKWEAGITIDGRMVVADVIDGDSMRVKYQGREVSKQLFRDGEDIAVVEAGLAMVARLTDRFPL